MNIEIKPTTKAECMYTFSQSQQIAGQTGCIGHLRADMDTDGKGFFTSWFDHARFDLNSDEFKTELDGIINALRFDSKQGDILKDRDSLARYCHAHPECRMDGNENNYGLRIDTEKHSFLFRLNPDKGNYNMYCYCYRRDWLDQHMRNAEKGIRFIDSNYNDMFTLPDGGRIQVTNPDGEKREYVCRFIDPYHVEVGSGAFNLYHICEFAERMEQNGCKVEPIDFMPGEERRFQIYQLKDIPENADVMFMGMQTLRKSLGKDVDFNRYERVYEDCFPMNQDLEDIYTRFNMHKPEDFKGRSLSVSDIVVVVEGKHEDAYFVDVIGFTQVPCPADRDKLTQKAVERQHSAGNTSQIKKGQPNKDKRAVSVRKAKTQPGLE